MDLKDKSALNGYRREFLEHVKNKLHGEFDRGFFSAWADCMRVLNRISIPDNVPTPNINNVAPREQEVAEDQSTIESFLEEKAD
jgi:hypothetical protein